MSLLTNISQKEVDPFISVLPDTFSEAIDRSNQKAQTRNAPCALVLQAEYDDHRQSIRGSASQHLILQLAKTHHVTIKTINTISLVGKTINETACKTRQAIRLLCVMGHGEQDGSIRFGKCEESPEMNWTISDLKKEDFMRLHPEARIVLLACYTGLKFAQQLADCSKRTVMAPNHPMYIDLTVFSHSGNIVSYSPNEKLNMSVFIPHQKSRSIFGIDTSTRQALFNERFKYLEKQAASGDAKAQLSLGLFHSKGLGGMPRSDAKALKWYLSSAKLGLAEAQYQVGLFYSKGMGGLARDEQQAWKWFHLAADQGHAKSQVRMGSYHQKRHKEPASDEKALEYYLFAVKQGLAEAQYQVGNFAIRGKGGFAVSDAAYWFRLAAEEGHAEAQFMLGIGYEQGFGGLHRSSQDALYWYKLAEDQGLEKAIDRRRDLAKLQAHS